VTVILAIAVDAFMVAIAILFAKDIDVKSSVASLG
jgi:hypothetical protein